MVVFACSISQSVKSVNPFKSKLKTLQLGACRSDIWETVKVPKFTLITHCMQHLNVRSSCTDVFCKKGALKNFANFTRKNLCCSFILIKLKAWRSGNFMRKRLQHRCFFVNYAKILRTRFLQNTSGRLHLE